MRIFEEKALERLRFLEQVERQDRLTHNELNQLMLPSILFATKLQKSPSLCYPPV